jgi:AmmeMemoRadiSam system protein B
MSSRGAFLAGSWYPSDDASCSALLDGFLSSADVPPDLGRVLGCIAPHAGWLYSGPTAALAFAALGEPTPATVAVLGVPHRVPVARAVASAADAWETPLGPVAVDAELRDALLTAAPELVAAGDDPHPPGENSIEVLVPFVRRFFPDASILPVTIPAGDTAVAFGEAAGAVFADAGDRVAVIGSTDLTHYGAAHFGFAPHGGGEEGHRWAKDVNDHAFLERVRDLDAEGALRESRRNRSACGGGATAAAIAACRRMGASRGVVLEHTTSWEVHPQGEPSDFVGYAAVALCA